MRVGLRCCIRKPSTVVLVLAVAGTLAATGIALAAGSSTSSFKFTPSNVPRTTFQSGQLNVHTHTDYTNPGNGNPGGATERIQLFFDNDLKFSPTAFPTCDPAGFQPNETMAQAMAHCGTAKIGQGTFRSGANSMFFASGCVLAFNGKPSGGHPWVFLYMRSGPLRFGGGGIDCSHPATNHETGRSWVAASPLTSVNSGGFGRKLDFNQITAVSQFPLLDVNVTVKRGSYISARCPASPWKMKTVFTYNDATTQTVNSTQPCT